MGLKEMFSKWQDAWDAYQEKQLEKMKKQTERTKVELELEKNRAKLAKVKASTSKYENESFRDPFAPTIKL